MTENVSYVPYQAYKSKRHSRNFSGPAQGLNQSPPPRSRPTSFIEVVPSLTPSGEEKEVVEAILSQELRPPTNGLKDVIVDFSKPSTPNGFVISESVEFNAPRRSPSPNQARSASPSLAHDDTSKAGPLKAPEIAVTAPVESASMTSGSAQEMQGNSQLNESKLTLSTPSSSSPAASTSAASQSSKPPLPAIRKSSTFRHVPLRARNPLPSSPLRPGASAHSRTVSQPSQPVLELSTPSRLSSSVGPTRPVDAPSGFTHGKERATASASTTPSTSPRSVHKPLPLHPGHTHSKSADIQPPRSLTPNGTLTPPPRTSSLLNVSSPSSTPPPPPHAPPAAIQPQASSSSTASVPTSVVTPFSPRSAAGSPLPSHRAPAITRTPAPYRPGFQPKGVYRPRTDEFVDARRATHDAGAARIERTKLERRFEKLVALHFPPPDEAGPPGEKHGGPSGKDGHSQRPGPGSGRRASSFFDLDLSELRSSIGNVDPSDLWRGIMMQGQAGRGGKNDTRAAEQRITPWEEDSTITKCPLCSASFHPLTNRKHHCRLCGKIICSLPVKRPQRSLPCSLLFVVDPKTRMVEEVGEGVDYGVRRRRTTSGSVDAGKGPLGSAPETEEEKFLKGVRICRDCRPVLLRQQYQQEMSQLPPFARLYEVFITLEKEIEASLPQFQELLLSLNHDDHPTKEVMAARKRLLDAFAQYDALAKRIRRLPCPSGGSQDRIQLAVMTRANLFLQKHMFPLQSLPKRDKHSSSPKTLTPTAPAIDPDSALVHALQPLLEQEALLESYVEEANAHRKFEDAKTLKVSLAEIRAEIAHVTAKAGAEGGMQQAGKKRAGKGK
ncbi:hypothetical protein HGRIS_013576 [Hohenbuehelia grisea]|uniref:FYVE-type domain-containing protein n=1 Tax=Hohenbuehelia grisea TaxID=104357 RepID=A0ABR3IW80_9AGAR